MTTTAPPTAPAWRGRRRMTPVPDNYKWTALFVATLGMLMATH